MNKIKDNCIKHYYFILFFGFIILYNFVNTSGFNFWKVNGNTYLFHLVDFSMGFCSKFLPGAIFNLIFSDTSQETVSFFCLMVFLIVVLFISALSERLILSTTLTNKRIVIFLLLLFVTGTSVIPMCVYRMGSLDSYWIFFSVISLFFLGDKRLYIFIVLSTLLSVMVNFGSMICYVPFIVLLMIYKTTVVDDKKEKAYLWSIVVAVIISSVLLCAYFLMFEQNNLKYSFEKFSEILEDRGFQGTPVYYGMNLYGIDFFDAVDFEHINSIDSPVLRGIVLIFHRIAFNISKVNIQQGIAPMLLSFPVVGLIVSYFKNRITNKSESIMKRLSCLCIIGMFFCTFIFGVFFSTDVVRFLGHAYSILFASFLYVTYKEKGDGFDFIRKSIEKIPKNYIALYCMCYVFMVFDPMGTI